MIAIIGKPGVGKSHLLDKLQKRGFKTLKADVFFSNSYLHGNKCYKLIKNQLGAEFVDKKTVLKAKLKQ
jgi:dephospho-CoA kinase